MKISAFNVCIVIPLCISLFFLYNSTVRLYTLTLLNSLKVSRLKEEVEGAAEEAEEERLKRLSTKSTMTREVEAVERSCEGELRRVASAHNIDAQHLRQVS